MKGLFKGAARLTAAGALGLAAVAATTGAAEAQGWRHYSGATTVVRCNAWGYHCRRVLVYRYGPYYGRYHDYGRHHHYGWNRWDRDHDHDRDDYGYERHHRW